MGIKRSPHNKENPYILLNKSSLWDPDLSLEAVGLWARLMSRPDDWDFNVEELSKTFRKSKDKINDILNELIEHGYAYRQQRRDPDASGKYRNRFSKWDIWILEKKFSKEEISNILSETGLSGPIPSGPLESSLINNESNQVKKKRYISPSPLKNPEKVADPFPEPESYEEVFKGVFLRPSQKKELMTRLSQNSEDFAVCCLKLTKWKEGKTVNTDDMAQMEKWVIDSVLKDKNKSEASEACCKLFRYVKGLKSSKIVTGRDYVEFLGLHDAYYKLGDKGFFEKVSAKLKHVGISVPKLEM